MLVANLSNFLACIVFLTPFFRNQFNHTHEGQAHKQENQSQWPKDISTVPITAFPIPIVKTDVRVAAGVVKEVGTTAGLPTTICRQVLHQMRAIPKTTAVNTWQRLRVTSPNGLVSSAHGQTSFNDSDEVQQCVFVCCHKGNGRQNHNE